MILDFILFGYLLNLIAFIATFISYVYVGLKTTDEEKLANLALISKQYRTEIISSGGRRLILHLSDSILIPFGRAFWYFHFILSSFGVKGDLLDKTIAYYSSKLKGVQ